jgi:hypothetical protein
MVSDAFQLLERNTHRRHQLFVALSGAVATLLMWWLHLTHPAIFVNAFLRGGVGKAYLVMVLAPPFVMVFGLANVVFFKAPTDSGMSARCPAIFMYRRLRENGRSWWDRYCQCRDFFLMLFTAGAG